MDAKIKRLRASVEEHHRQLYDAIYVDCVYKKSKDVLALIARYPEMTFDMYMKQVKPNIIRHQYLKMRLLKFVKDNYERLSEFVIERTDTNMYWLERWDSQLQENGLRYKSRKIPESFAMVQMEAFVGGAHLPEELNRLVFHYL